MTQAPLPQVGRDVLVRRPVRRPPHLRVERLRLADGAATTVHVAAYDARRTRVRVLRFPRPTPLLAWCGRHGVADALVGGFSVCGSGPVQPPLGEVRTSGITRASVAFDAPWDALRSCVHVAGARVTIDRRDALPPAPGGDLLQAGPLLVRGGRVVPGDEEGFSAGAGQFDSDITVGRHPRAALGHTRDGRLLAVACDGRSRDEAGLTLGELAEALVALGAVQALNLDGGGSTSLVCRGRLRNEPREPDGALLPGGRPIATALALLPR